MSCKRSDTDSIENLKNIDSKVIKILQSYDIPQSYYWALSTNRDWLDSLDTPLDDYILCPDSTLPKEFKISNLRVAISGKKYLNKNNYLTSPYAHGGFGYYFEISEIKRKN